MAGPAAEFAAVPDTAVLQHFRECSLEAREVLDKLQLAPGEHMLREDVPEVLRRAAGLPGALSGADISCILATFRLDASGTISEAEFMSSWRALQQLGSADPAASASPGRRRGVAGRAVGAAPRQAPLTSQPHNSAAEIGWLHAAAPLPVSEAGEGPGGRHAPLRTSDVTRGEGRSAASYFGMYSC